jgi:outer membrane lipoprotein carrier protein
MPQLSSYAIIALALVSAIGVEARQQGTSPSAQAVADRLQKKYDTVRDFSADFVHRYEGGTLKRTREERGALLVKKPGKIRWTYKAPEEKVFVSNGVKLYQYMPLDHHVTMSDAPGDEQPAMSLLAGKGNLNRDFTVSFSQTPSAADVWTLRLEPRTAQADYDWLEIAADRSTLQLRTLVVAEKQGNRSTFTFSNFKENAGLADKLFEFAIPKGVEVTNAGKR